jgi:hypothetical protein
MPRLKAIQVVQLAMDLMAQSIPTVQVAVAQQPTVQELTAVMVEQIQLQGHQLLMQVVVVVKVVVQTELAVEILLIAVAAVRVIVRMAALV